MARAPTPNLTAEMRRFADLLRAEGVQARFSFAGRGGEPSSPRVKVRIDGGERIGRHVSLNVRRSPEQFVVVVDEYETDEDGVIEGPRELEQETARTIYEAEQIFAQLVAKYRGRKLGRVGERDERYRVPLPNPTKLKRPVGPAATLKGRDWLLRNAKKIESLSVVATKDGGLLTATMEDGNEYTSDFPSFHYALEWIDQPKLREKRLDVNGAGMTVGDAAHRAYVRSVENTDGQELRQLAKDLTRREYAGSWVTDYSTLVLDPYVRLNTRRLGDFIEYQLTASRRKYVVTLRSDIRRSSKTYRTFGEAREALLAMLDAALSRKSKD